jgi:hypothetical protein
MNIARVAAALTVAASMEIAGPPAAVAATTALQAGAPMALQSALAKPTLRPDQQQLRLALEHKLTAAQLARLQSAIAAVRAVLDGQKTGDPAALAGAGARAAFPGAAGGDIAALTFLVMAEAANGSDSDLATLMTQMQAQENAKRSLRGAGTPSPSPAPSSDIDSQMQMELQLAMSQRSQFETVLSNLMKSFNNAAASITQNLK